MTFYLLLHQSRGLTKDVTLPRPLGSTERDPCLDWGKTCARSE